VKTKIDYERKAMAEMASIADMDEGTRHVKADEILCSLLCALGCDEIVKLYTSYEKWYE